MKHSYLNKAKIDLALIHKEITLQEAIELLIVIENYKYTKKLY